MSDTPGQAISPSVESGSPAGETPKLTTGVTAKLAAIAAKSARRGRPRNDNLLPGSPEAKEADRLYQTTRKAAWRAKVRAEAPPPIIPSKSQLVESPQPAQSPGVDSGPVAGFVSWDSSVLNPLFEELVPALEQEAIASLTGKAAKAQLPAPILKQIERDAAWSPTAKKALVVTGPQVAAKWLNKLGVSAENQGEVVIAVALVSITFTHLRLAKKLDKLIAERATPPPQAKAINAN